jgi:membrane protease YdiL (CAAX protease family)
MDGRQSILSINQKRVVMFTSLNSFTKSALFYILAVGLAVVSALFASGVRADGAGILNMLTPLLAVLLMLLVVTRSGFGKAGWLALGLHRAGLQRWGLALLGPLVVLGVTYSIVWSTGIGRFVWTEGQSAGGFVVGLVINIAILTLLAMGEEIGFRGYLLPHLLSMGRTRALLLSGLMHGAWHLPIMLLTPYSHNEGNPWIIVPLFLLTLTATGVFYGYLRLTSASTWPAAIGHSAFNVLWDRFTTLTVAGSSPLLLEYLAGESGLLTLVDAAVMAGWLLYRLNRREEPVQTQPLSATEGLTV